MLNAEPSPTDVSPSGSGSGSGFALASVLERVALWFLAMVVVACCYGLGKFGALLSTPTELPLTALDRAVPLAPWTVWIYGTVTWVSLAAWLSVPDRGQGARLFTTMSVAAVTCALVFLVFPTSFPRELYPLGSLDSASLRELASLRVADSATNCFPSLHVALAWGIALSWRSSARASSAASSRTAGATKGGPGRFDLRRAWFGFVQVAAPTWAVAVTLTTLTTKQHFALDLPAGALVGVGAWWVSCRVFQARSSTPTWARSQGLALSWETHRGALAKLRRKVEGYQWSLDEIAWPEGPLAPLDPILVRLINELIYIEEIAGLNFGILARASVEGDLRVLYTRFAEEERRHADGLRRLLALHGAALHAPGLGNTLVLREFDALDPNSEADVLLIATANPVFETMLDAGTVPFLRQHPALRSPWFEDFIRRISRDESAHMAVNWMVIREAGARYRGLRGLVLLLNPSILRGMAAVPFMSLDVYSLAHRLGYRFEVLLPAFGKLWRLHRRYAELRWFPLWWLFRLFTAAGALATWACVWLARLGLMFIRFWTSFTRLTDALARGLFGRRLLAKRGLPLAPAPPES